MRDAFEIVKLCFSQAIKDDPNGHIVQGGSGFGRYCFYGCHCLPDAEHAKVSPPFGIPIDGVDRTCRQMGTCYKCLEVITNISIFEKFSNFEKNYNF